nr:ABC transporter permease subunit [uncultured Cohaesibacter sp.]
MRRFSLLLSILFWALVWEIAARAIGSSLFPPLSNIILTVGEVVHLHSFQEALGQTVRDFLIGMALIIVVGISLGFLMGRYKTCDRILNVWVNIFLSAPLTAVIPALMPLLGIGEVTVVATVFLFGVWVLIIDTREGVRDVPRSLIEMGRVYGATRWQMFSRIMLIHAMPEVMTGLRLACVRGVRGLIVGQIVIALTGFGGLFQTFLEGFSTERFWALVIIVFTLSFAVTGLVGLVERRLTRHAKARG